MAVVRAVFNSYDSSKTGELMRQDYMRILRDCNQAGQLLQLLRKVLEDLSHVVVESTAQSMGAL